MAVQHTELTVRFCEATVVDLEGLQAPMDDADDSSLSREKT